MYDYSVEWLNQASEYINVLFTCFGEVKNIKTTLSKFQVHNTFLLTTAATLYNRSLDFSS